jgi:threonine synthase
MVPMRFRSTRGGPSTGIVEAIMQGLAEDGGLYVPETLPVLVPGRVSGDSLAEIAADVLRPFFAGTALAPRLDRLCTDALDFPVPLRDVHDGPPGLKVLELFHGPTAAFKDVGARFLAAVMEQIEATRGTTDGRPLTILVATSGDTGGAVAAAFFRRQKIRVAVLFPLGQVSARQRQQLTCWGENVLSLEVEGSFDDCQALVKAAFTDSGMNERFRFSAANSINLGRLLPQVAYHAAAALWHWRASGERLNMIVPTGNLGNGLACIWARAIGMPVGDIVLAVNANRTIPDFLETGAYRPRASLQTLASAMDVGAPSNMERLRHLVPQWETLKSQVHSSSVDDTAIREQIARDYARYGEIWCPHTATGFAAYDRLPDTMRTGTWAVCATAHPAKFESIVEPIVGKPVAVPPTLARILEKPSHVRRVAAELSAVDQALSEWDAERNDSP